MIAQADNRDNRYPQLEVKRLSIISLIQEIESEELDEPGPYINDACERIIEYASLADTNPDTLTHTCMMVDMLVDTMEGVSEFSLHLDNIVAIFKRLLIYLGTDMHRTVRDSCMLIISKLDEMKDDKHFILALLAYCNGRVQPRVCELCIGWITQILIQSPYLNRPATLYRAIFTISKQVASESKNKVLFAAAKLLSCCFTLRPLLLLPYFEGLDQETKRVLACQLPNVVSVVSMPFGRDGVDLLCHILNGESAGEDKPVSVESATLLEQFLNLKAPRLTPSMLNLLYHPDVIQALVRYITRCENPNPDPDNVADHMHLKRSFRAVNLLIRPSRYSHALLKEHGAVIAQILITEGFTPGSSNLYHVCCLLLYLLDRYPFAVCRAVMSCSVLNAASPFRAILKAISHPLVPQLLQKIASHPCLFPLLNEGKLLDQLTAVAVDGEDQDSIGATKTIIYLLETWSTLSESRTLLNRTFVEFIVSSPITANSIDILLGFARIAVSRRNIGTVDIRDDLLIKEMSDMHISFSVAKIDATSQLEGMPCSELSGNSLEEGSVKHTNIDSDITETACVHNPVPPMDEEFRKVLQEIWDVLESSTPMLTQILIDDRVWDGDVINNERVSLLTLVLSVIVTNPPACLHLPQSFFPIMWGWSCDPFVSPIVHAKLHKLWKVVFADPYIFSSVFSEKGESVVQAVAYWSQCKSVWTIHSVMDDLYRSSVELLQKQLSQSSQFDNTLQGHSSRTLSQKEQSTVDR
uniref:Uncharacterized protein n=1 Tax=Spongospora subterranea TaxID=70186 RepID=A0A0H5R8A7_9EUKA|eukprot:CRZ10365.1 hypothetical protein [Spongospora subterranea]